MEAVRRALPEDVERLAELTAHAVSELPLASGAIALEERVPEHLTDERTEVGQVGSALNAMLEHVEASLGARHKSEQQVRQFVADASHELRTPLTTIAGYTELARSRPDDKAAADTALAKVEEESGRMTALVEDLLLLARLDSGPNLDVAPVDLSEVVINALSDARAAGPDHVWQLDLPPEPVVALGDRYRLHQVVANLLANARTHTPPGTRVRAAVAVDGADAVVTVTDTGPGIPDTQPKMSAGSGVSFRCHTSPVTASMACPVTDQACTSNPTNVRFRSTEASRNCGSTDRTKACRQPTHTYERGLSPCSYRLVDRRR